MEKKPISVSKEELNENLFEDVLFFKFAEGGAMGEPGGVVWVKANGESYHCNYCYGDVRYEDLLKLFAPLKKCSFGMFGLGSTVPGEWKYVSLGMGNHLIVAASAYDEFKEITKDVQRVSELYGRWYETALKITRKEKETTKMKNGITELVFILDRSGSMAGLESDTIGGFNAMIEEQKKLDGKVYVSFSGGKDSTVLYWLARKIYPDIKAVFCNTGNEYPDIVRFVNQMKEGGGNIEIIRPKLKPQEVMQKYGFPLISKETSGIIKDVKYNPNSVRSKRALGLIKASYRGQIPNKWKFLIDEPFWVSKMCCDKLKKELDRLSKIAQE